MAKYILALDQGTTSSRCILFNHQGEICGMAQREITQIFPQPGWVEHDPMEIWESQSAVLQEAVRKSGIDFREIAAIGITNQRETTIVWEKETGRPIYNAIVWQCRRTADRMERLQAEGLAESIRAHTGLLPDAYFSASKLAWILDTVPGARERAEKGELLFGTVDTWLLWRLTNGAVHATDHTNASRTMLFDIYKKEWCPEILDYFDIPRCMLPQVKPSGAFYGMASITGAPQPIPIAGVAGDQQAALFGQCCFEKGSLKNTYGTGCFLLLNTGERAVQSQHGLLTTLAASTSDTFQYALEGSVFVAGAAIRWLRDAMGMLETAQESEAACRAVSDTAGVYLVPAFAGLGAPYWNPCARGMAVGITGGTTREHFIRAAVESLAYQTYDLIDAMKQELGTEIGDLMVDGGASANDFLMQFQADLNQGTILRPQCIETTALGAAYLAGLTVGFWKDREEIRRNRKIAQVFRPQSGIEEQSRRLRGWHRCVKAALAWAEDAENAEAEQ